MKNILKLGKSQNFITLEQILCVIMKTWDFDSQAQRK